MSILALFLKESDEFIKSSVEDLVPIPSESEDILEGDSDCDLPSCDDFSPINIPKGNSVTFSNPLFNSNNDFTSSDEESLSDEDVPEDNVKIYSNPLFEFDDEYISSDVNPLFDEVLEDIESKDSYVPKLDEPDLLITSLSDANEDECFDPGGDIDEINAFLDIDISTNVKDGYHDSEGDIIYLERLLINNTFPNLPSEVKMIENGAKTGIYSFVAIKSAYLFEAKTNSEKFLEHDIGKITEKRVQRVYEVGESSTAAIPQEDGDRLLPGFMRWDIDSLFGRIVNFSRRLCGRETAYALVEKKSEAKDKFYGKLILDLGNEVRSSVDQGMAAMERLVEKLGNVKEKVECKKLKKELEEAKLSNTFLRMQNERVDRDLYWTRVRAHEFYQEMIRKGFVFEERPNEAIDVPIEDVKSSSPKEIMPPKSAPMTQAAMRRMIKESVDAAIAVERERSGLTWWNSKVATLGLENVNQIPLTEMKQLMTVEFCPIEEIQRLENEL
ncbi:hypothetical protein Tco_0671498 [Tanacetum coccineum]